ncbi:MAG: cation diffusion facilitator family transporter [Erysipelotrichaceae bacterium]|nr:cation diffusion facilitator family transporter [Erysipelotrichaceae bacterium]MDP3304526.1 cation diffusion facilitator family transporter [Erysipelotrichaceae bacterium]
MNKNKKVLVVLWVTLFLNILVSSIKIIVGLLTGIGSILADGYHSLADASSNIIGLFTMRIAQKPIDEDHAYGHQRYETLATLFIVALLTYLGIEVIFKSIEAFQNPSFTRPETLTLLLMIFTFGVNIFVATYENIAGKKLKSTLLVADAKHTLSDIYISAGVLINLILITFFNAPLWLDAATSLLVALIIFKTAYGIFRESSHELTDAIAIDPQLITDIVLKNPRAYSIHKIRSRKSGSQVFIDFHVKSDPNMPLVDAHNLSHDLENELRSALGEDMGVIVHVEPEGYSYKKRD